MNEINALYVIDFIHYFILISASYAVRTQRL